MLTNMLSCLTKASFSWLLMPLILVGGLAGCDSTENGLTEPEAVGGPALLRRLTESQYRKSISDIFGPDVPVVARFERALRAEGLVAVGTSEAGLSSFAMEQYDSAAQSVADIVFSEGSRAKYMPCQPEMASQFDESCAEAFVSEYGPQLFRRPLTDEQINRYTTVARLGTEKLGNFYEGMKFALVGMMTAPQFLLRIEHTQPQESEKGTRQLDAYSKAERLSYFLTNSTPDQELMRAAESGELDTEEGLSRQVDRLITSPGFETAVRAFFRDMLEFDLFDDLAKDSSIYPAYNSTVAADSQEQTLKDIVHLLVDQHGDYRDLFTLEESFMSRALGVVYRQPVVSRDGWEQQKLSHNGERLGIQSQVSFLALHSHPGRSSPTLRGEAVRSVFLCQEVPDPPADIDFSIVQEPSSTNMPTARDRLHLHNSEPACAGCHKVMDPVGFALENFDGLGAFRTHENETLIDTSGFLDGMAYDDAKGLAQALHDHPETPRCVVERMYRFAVGRDTEWYERSYMDYLIDEFAASDYRVPELMRVIALSNNFFTIAEPSADHLTFESASSTLQEENPL
ncbi:DUF1592 domain-containing protein [Pseudomaricurvus sp.]|uniref:DUF1592 domain-containing protein n=1 Tax=Pseudomaricurvus sp. TaxID=2004510 RepID=UPI003F6B3530